MGLLDDAIRDHLDLKRKHGASEEEIVQAEQEALAPARREMPPEPFPADDESPAEVSLGDEPEPSPQLGEPGAPAEPPPPPAAEPAAVGPPPPPVDEPVFADEYGAEPAPADADDDELPGELEPAAEDLSDEDLSDEVTRIREVVPGPEDEPAARDFVEAPDPGTPKPHGDPALADDDLDPDEVPVDEQLSDAPDPYRARTSILDDPLDDTAPPPPAQPPPDDDGQDVLEETPDFLQETPEHDKLWFEQKPPRDFDFD